MGKHETIIPIEPPAPMAPKVRLHRRALEQSRDQLRAARAELLWASARGEPGSKEALSDLRRKIADLDFEIEHNGLAFDRASEHDVKAFAEWRAAVYRLDPEQLLEGISKDQCAARCLRGINGGCVILAGYAYGGTQCCHPILEKHIVHGRDQNGERQFSYRNSPEASKLFELACRKLKVIQ